MYLLVCSSHLLQLQACRRSLGSQHVSSMGGSIACCIGTLTLSEGSSSIVSSGEA